MACSQAVFIEAEFGLCEDKMVEFSDSSKAEIYCPYARQAAKKLMLSDVTANCGIAVGNKEEVGRITLISRKAITKEEVNIKERVGKS